MVCIYRNQTTEPGGPILAPKQEQATSGTVRHVSRVHAHGASFLPASNSNSSKRVKAAFQAHQSLFCSEKKSTYKRAKRKSEKQETFLHIVKPTVHALSDEFLESHIVFADGGNVCNPRIRPAVHIADNKNNKSIKVLLVANNELFVPQNT